MDTNVQADQERAWFEQLDMEVLLDGPRGSSNHTVTFRGQECTLFDVACRFITSGKTASLEQFIADEKDYRTIFPVACALGDIEHARWTASYEAFGWQPLADERQEWAIADIDDFLTSNGSHCDQAMKPARNSKTLKRHTYMAMSGFDLLKRGQRFDTDPYAYDRIINAYTVRILQERVTQR